MLSVREKINGLLEAVLLISFLFYFFVEKVSIQGSGLQHM